MLKDKPIFVQLMMKDQADILAFTNEELVWEKKFSVKPDDPSLKVKVIDDGV